MLPPVLCSRLLMGSGEAEAQAPVSKQTQRLHHSKKHQTKHFVTVGKSNFKPDVTWKTNKMSVKLLHSQRSSQSLQVALNLPVSASLWNNARVLSVVRCFASHWSDWKVCVWSGLVPFCALTVHGHGRSQRVSLRGVSTVLPFFWRVDQIEAQMGRDARRCACMGELLSTVLQTDDGNRDQTRSLPYASRPFGVWDAGTGLQWNLRPPPPPPLPHRTAGRQKVITPWMLLDPGWITKPVTEIVSCWFYLHPFVETALRKRTVTLSTL